MQSQLPRALNALAAVIAMEKAILRQKEPPPDKEANKKHERFVRRAANEQRVEVPGQGVWVFTRNISHPGNC